MTPQRRNKEIIANFGTGAPVDPLRDVEGRAYGLHIVSNKLPKIYFQVLPAKGQMQVLLVDKRPLGTISGDAAAPVTVKFGFEAEFHRVPGELQVKMPVVRADAFGSYSLTPIDTFTSATAVYTLYGVDVDASVLARSTTEKDGWFVGCATRSPYEMCLTVERDVVPATAPIAKTDPFRTRTKVHRTDATATAEQLLTMLVDADESYVYLPATDTFHRRMHSARTRVGLVFNAKPVPLAVRRKKRALEALKRAAAPAAGES